MLKTTGAPSVRIDGSIITIKRAGDQRGAHFSRDDVATAYLLLVDYQERTADDALRARDVLVSEFGIDRSEATRCVMAAALLVDHNIEP